MAGLLESLMYMACVKRQPPDLSDVDIDVRSLHASAEIVGGNVGSHNPPTVPLTDDEFYAAAEAAGLRRLTDAESAIFMAEIQAQSGEDTP